MVRWPTVGESDSPELVSQGLLAHLELTSAAAPSRVKDFIQCRRQRTTTNIARSSGREMIDPTRSHTEQERRRARTSTGSGGGR